MSILPVAERELRLLARLPRTYRARALAAAFVATVSLGLLYAGFGGMLSAASAGRSLFLILSMCAGIYVLLDGAITTADCLSQEKRDGTIGLLFLTDLKGYDVVAGKLISRAASSIYCLLAAFPAALGIALLLGGVTGHEFFAMTLALLNGFFFAASFGMLISALCRQERRALSLAVLGVVGMAGLLPALGWALSIYRSAPGVDSRFLLGSPIGAFLAALDLGATGTTPAVSFTQTLATSHGLAWVFLIAASLILPNSWRESSVRPSLGQWWRRRTRRKKNASRLPSHPFAPASQWQEDNPLIAAGQRAGHRGLGFWPLFLVFGIAWIVGWACLRNRWLDLPIYAISVALLHLTLIFSVLLHACRGPGEDRRSGVLEILLTTPLGADVYLRGRMLSLKRQCLTPLLLVMAADLGWLLAGSWQSQFFPFGSVLLSWEWLAWFGVFLALTVKLLIDLYTVSWVGVWQGVKSSSAGQAIRKTIFCVFLLRWIVLLGLLAVFGLLTQGQVFNSSAGGMLAAGGYAALLIASVLYFCAAAMSDLRDNLQSLALAHGEKQI